jgi:hypothetical protein
VSFPLPRRLSRFAPIVSNYCYFYPFPTSTQRGYKSQPLLDIGSGRLGTAPDKQENIHFSRGHARPFLLFHPPCSDRREAEPIIRPLSVMMCSHHHLGVRVSCVRRDSAAGILFVRVRRRRGTHAVQGSHHLPAVLLAYKKRLLRLNNQTLGTRGISREQPRNREHPYRNANRHTFPSCVDAEDWSKPRNKSFAIPLSDGILKTFVCFFSCTTRRSERPTAFGPASFHSLASAPNVSVRHTRCW